MYKKNYKNLISFFKLYKNQEVKTLCKNYCRIFMIYSVIFIGTDMVRLCFLSTSIYYLHEFFRLLSIIFAVIAVAGHPGWKIQSWGGENPVEKWNNWIILILISLSGFINLFI